MRTTSTSHKADLRATQSRYLEEIALVRRPNTVVNARTASNGFIAYLEREHPQMTSFRELGRRHIVGWFHDLRARSLKQSTRRNAIIKVRGFLETLQEDGWPEAPREALFLRGDLPPEDRYLPRPLPPDADRALQEELRRHDRLIPKALLLMRATGLRVQEVLDLQTGALSKHSSGRWTLHVPLGKLHSERVIPIDGEASTLFSHMRELRSSTSDRDGEGFLLVHRDGRRYSREALRHALKAAAKRAGLSEHPTPHRLRHSYATELLRAGIKLPVLMKLLGHRTIGMTLRYAALTGVDVENAYREAIDVVNARYGLAAVRPKRPRSQTSASNAAQPSILERLGDVETQLDRFRRDQTTGDRHKKIGRLLERLRRLKSDIDAATS